MKKRFFTALLCLMLVVALVGCGPAQQFLSGRIADKIHEEAHTEVMTGTRPMVCGKITICMPYTYTLSCPESWKIIFIDQDGRKREIEVWENYWNKLTIGDLVEYDRWNGTIKTLEGAT